MPEKIETVDQAKDVMREALFPGSKNRDLSVPPQVHGGGPREPSQMPKPKKAAAKPDGEVTELSDEEKKKKEEEEKAKGKPVEETQEEKDRKAAEAAAAGAKPKRVKKPAVDKSAAALEKAAGALETAATAIAASATKTDKKEDKKVDDEVPEARREDLAVFTELESMGEKFAGKRAEYVKFAKKEDTYIKGWLADNPGKEFDPESDDHTDFYEANEPEVSERDIRRAEIRLEAKPLAEQMATEKSKGIQDRLEQFESADKIRETAPKIQENIGIAFGAALSAMSPDILKLVGEKGHEALKESDPEAAAVMEEIGPRIVGAIDASVKLFAMDGKGFDSNNELHQEVATTALNMEKEFAEYDIAQLTQPDGKTFVTRHAWNQMTPQQREKHWIVGAQEVNMALTAKYADKVKTAYENRIKDTEKGAKARGWTKNPQSKVAEKETADGKVVEDDKAVDGEGDDGKPQSPSTSSSTLPRPGEGGPGKGKEKPLDFMSKGMFGR